MSAYPVTAVSASRLPRLRPLVWLGLFVALMVEVCAQTASADAVRGTLTGTVSNAGTGNLLEGARVEVPALRLSVLTDHTGRFQFSAVPAGEHEVVASYVGLDAVKRKVTVEAGRSAPANFDLNTAVYKLDKFVVAGPREGAAAAITAQRNAENVKNVVAMDSYGNMPNMSAGELAIRLPGVAAGLDDEGNVTGLIVRGQGAASNRVTVDGGLIANSANLSRQFQTHSMTGAMFEELEVVKGHTPDKAADSLGGTINLKTRSPLSMREKRRFTYSASARVAPSFTDQVPLREAHRAHPLVNLSYQEVFDAFGGDRNLGVAVNGFYSENVAGGFRTIRDYQNTTAQPAYLFNYATQDFYNNRKQSSMNVKVDYRLSPATKISLNTIYNDAFEPFNRLYEVVATAPQTIATLDANGQPTGTGGILPDFTGTLTRARAVAGSNVTVNETMFSFLNRTRAVDLGVEHNSGRWRFDGTAAYSQSHVNLGVGGGGTLTNTLSTVGWTLDRSQSDLYPRFTQTAGPDITDIANYRPGQLTTRNDTRTSEVTNFRGNARYELPFAIPSSLKTGFDWREQVAGAGRGQKRWTYAGGTKPLVRDTSIVSWDSIKTGRNVPFFETAALIRDNNPVDPSLWTEDNYFRESQKFIGESRVTETATAAYLMGQAKFGQLGLLTGVRAERTEVESFGYVRARTLSTAAQQTADPAGSALRDYGNNAKRIDGDYTKAFPSVHLSYNLTANLKAHASWSTSFGRPPFSNLVPAETPNETNRTLTINNPALKPQYARNWDTTLEYYFEPVGMVSVGWFYKDIRDYIVTGIDGGIVPTGAGNGFNGEYAGFNILQTDNAGSAYVQGWEFSYQQQFTFLPGLLRGLGASVNYTVLSAHGIFAGTTYLTTYNVAGFIPETGNANLTWRWRGFGVRVRANYHGRYINAFNATSPARNQYRFSRVVTDLDLSYDLSPGLSLTCTVSNLTNEPQQFYRYTPQQMERTILNGTTLTFGVSGRF